MFLIVCRDINFNLAQLMFLANTAESICVRIIININPRYKMAMCLVTGEYNILLRRTCTDNLSDESP